MHTTNTPHLVQTPEDLEETTSRLFAKRLFLFLLRVSPFFRRETSPFFYPWLARARRQDHQPAHTTHTSPSCHASSVLAPLTSAESAAKTAGAAVRGMEPAAMEQEKQSLAGREAQQKDPAGDMPGDKSPAHKVCEVSISRA